MARSYRSPAITTASTRSSRAISTIRSMAAACSSSSEALSINRPRCQSEVWRSRTPRTIERGTDTREGPSDRSDRCHRYAPAVHFETHRHRERRERLEAGFRQPWRDLLATRMRTWHQLSDEERDRLEYLALGLLVDLRWEAANGFELTDE